MQLSLKIFVPLCLLFLVLVLSYVAVDPTGLYISTAYLVFPIIAVVAGFRLSRLYAKSITGGMMTCLSVGILFWTLGEIFWYVFENLLHIDPFPSVADIFFLLAYIFFIYALLKEGAIVKKMFGQIRLAHIAVYIIIVSFFVIPISYYGVYQAYHQGATMLENGIAMAYGIGDLLLVVASSLVLLPLLQSGDGKFARFWITVTIGFAFFLLADILFGIFVEAYNGNVKLYRYIDLLWLAGYFSFAYAFLLHYDYVTSTREKLKKLMK
ncbi:MAG: hypothetical protein COU35_04520 [Candidatus Magasanikbacteria bacterium CG10_big_fil_rev_8_21_14_0_10_47_10]|uniref:Histidine kinase N-terminal 7TM region domain-containing protein n=1 Tax=Candidatus Magasanikbacteria bacterium CG10_big_fil_rev_8_21_14_0_10_47_10 TaxID=1974652 RepID=A0A2H0TRN3_9BACT|nr:MAG: hypothetical protein COU35_04520 [Candidatus Magasanikbacteria bacterium CG10_big_fil_rev_8_21_14_0_10_47_10]